MGIDEKYYALVKRDYRALEYGFSTWNVKFFQNHTGELIAIFENDKEIDIFISAKNSESLHNISDKFDFEWDYFEES